MKIFRKNEKSRSLGWAWMLMEAGAYTNNRRVKNENDSAYYTIYVLHCSARRGYGLHRLRRWVLRW